MYVRRMKYIISINLIFIKQENISNIWLRYLFITHVGVRIIDNT